MTLSCRILGGIIILWNVGGIIAGLAMCQPFAFNWDRTIPGGKCGKEPMYYLGLGIINIIVEITLICLPFPLVYKLQMPLRSRLVVIGMFSVGFGTIAMTIYRQTILPRIQFNDMPYSGFVAAMFSAVKPSIANCIACVPFLRMYFTRDWRNKKATRGLVVEDGSDKTKTKVKKFGHQNLDDDTSEFQLRPFE